MDWNRSILAKLLFCFVNLADEVNKSFSRLWHALLWPVSELELSHCSGLTVLQGESHTQPEDARRVQPRTAANMMVFPERKKNGGEVIEAYLTRSLHSCLICLEHCLHSHIYLHCNFFLLPQFRPHRVKSHLVPILVHFETPSLPLKSRWNLYTLPKICESNHFLILKGASRHVIESREFAIDTTLRLLGLLISSIAKWPTVTWKRADTNEVAAVDLDGPHVSEAYNFQTMAGHTTCALWPTMQLSRKWGVPQVHQRDC